MYNLKTYLRNVYELEASVYQQENCIRNIQNKISELPQKPSEPSSIDTIMGPLFIVIGIALAILVVSLFSGGGWFIALFLILPAGGFLLCGIVLSPAMLVRHGKERNEYTNNLSRFSNGQIVKTALESDVSLLRNKLSETQSLLRSYYAKGVLHPKYQNFVAVAYLLDCIDTGRYTKLDGPDGAYNQFELEVRMDRISSQLDTVIDKLDQIRQNQYSLYAAITQANRTNQMMFQKLDGYCRNLDTLNANAAQIRQSLNTANHTAELTRKEIAYRNYLDRGSSYSY